MSTSEKLFRSDFKNIEKIFDESSRAFELISQGKEKEALAEYPFETYLIKKYVSRDLTELTELLKLRLELH